MGAIEEAKRMKSQGLSEDQIIKALKDKKFPQREIDNALSNLKISAAVQEQNDISQQIPNPNIEESPSERFSGMEQSVMGPESQNEESQSQYQDQQYYTPPQEQYNQQYTPTQDYGQYPSQQQGYDYPQYQQYPSGTSSDVITEIAEQVMSEKMSGLRKNLEKVTDLKTTIESKIEYIDERLKRIEKIIDTLSASVLKKVGDYITDVQDIKKEIIETQKSFTKLVPELNKHHQKSSSHSHSKSKKHHKKK